MAQYFIHTKGVNYKIALNQNKPRLGRGGYFKCFWKIRVTLAETALQYNYDIDKAFAVTF